MSAFIIAQIAVRDRNEYSKYVAGFMEILTAHKGRLLSVDEDPHVFEGSWPSGRTVLFEFPSKDEALAWYRSPEYQRLAEHRFASSEGTLVMVQGRDRAGA